MDGEGGRDAEGLIDIGGWEGGRERGDGDGGRKWKGDGWMEGWAGLTEEEGMVSV